MAQRDDRKRLGKKHRQASTRPKLGRAPRTTPTTGAVDPRKRKSLSTKRAALVRRSAPPPAPPSANPSIIVSKPKLPPPARLQLPTYNHTTSNAPAPESPAETRAWRDAEILAAQLSLAADSRRLPRAPTHRHLRPPQRRQVDALQSPHRFAPLHRRRRTRNHPRPHLRPHRVAVRHRPPGQHRRHRPRRPRTHPRRNLPPGPHRPRRSRRHHHGRQRPHRARLARHRPRPTPSARRQARLPRRQQDRHHRPRSRRRKLPPPRLPQRPRHLRRTRRRHRRPPRRSLRRPPGCPIHRALCDGGIRAPSIGALTDGWDSFLEPPSLSSPNNEEASGPALPLTTSTHNFQPTLPAASAPTAHSSSTRPRSPSSAAPTSANPRFSTPSPAPRAPLSRPSPAPPATP